MITQEKLKEQLNYDKETGVFTWINSNHVHKAGGKAGHRSRTGYLRIYIFGKPHQDGKLAVLYETGVLPDFIGRVDKDHTNNAYKNIVISESKVQKKQRIERITRKIVMKALDGDVLPVGRLAKKLDVSPQSIIKKLSSLVKSKFLTRNHLLRYVITPDGHSELVRGGEFNSRSFDLSKLFQKCLPGTLTAEVTNEGKRQVFLRKMYSY